MAKLQLTGLLQDACKRFNILSHNVTDSNMIFCVPLDVQRKNLLQQQISQNLVLRRMLQM